VKCAIFMRNDLLSQVSTILLSLLIYVLIHQIMKKWVKLPCSK